MKYIIVTRDGKVWRVTADAPDLAEDKFFKRKNNRYVGVDIAAVVGYNTNHATKKDPRQTELFT